VLKLIINSFLPPMDSQNIGLVIQAVSKYAQFVGDNINNSLTAVGMFWNLADFIGKLVMIIRFMILEFRGGRES
jgi:hypothetical protein